ncbi:MAG: LuxR C-terminal-related transcriptional regulator, partial [Microcoleus sp.]
MNQVEFITIYHDLGNKCRQVLQQKLLGKTDQEIAQILHLKSEATVRQHLSKAYAAFRLSHDNKRGKWSDLQPL